MNDEAVSWTDATTLDELWEGDILGVELGEDAVLLAHLPGGVVKAYQGVCPHAEYPLAAGHIEGDVLTCAAHGWEFDLTTGEGVNPSTCQLYSFAIRRRGDQILVGIPQDGQRHYNRCRRR